MAETTSHVGLECSVLAWVPYQRPCSKFMVRAKLWAHAKCWVRSKFQVHAKCWVYAKFRSEFNQLSPCPAAAAPMLSKMFGGKCKYLNQKKSHFLAGNSNSKCKFKMPISLSKIADWLID